MKDDIPSIDDANPGQQRTGGTLPTIAYVRLCKRIEPEATDGSIVVTGLEQRYDTLILCLPLAGADALRPSSDGTPALTRYLFDEAPWLGTAIERIDRQLRLQLWAGRPWVAFRPLLLVGPLGCGKSHLARLIAERAGTGHAVLDLAGISDKSHVGRHGPGLEQCAALLTGDHHQPDDDRQSGHLPRRDR